VLLFCFGAILLLPSRVLRAIIPVPNREPAVPLKITDIKTVLLTVRCTNDPSLLEARKRRSAAFVEIHTSDKKIIGLGETYAGYFCPEAISAIAAFVEQML